MSCDISDVIKGCIDLGMGINAQLGLCKIQISLVTIQDDGYRPGLGLRTRTDKRITVYDSYSADYPDDGYLNPPISYVSSKDIFLSNGQLTDRDFKVQLVDAYLSCAGKYLGTSFTEFDPVSDDNNTEIYYHLLGPGLPSEGIYCTKISSQIDDSQFYKLYLRNTGRLVP